MMSTQTQVKPVQAVPASRSRKVAVVSAACVALIVAGALLVLQLTKWQVEPGTPIAESGPAGRTMPAQASPTAQGAARAGGAAVLQAESNAPSPENRAGGRMVPPDAPK